MYDCEADAGKALLALEKQLRYVGIENSEIKPVMGYKKAGRPSPNQTTEVLGYQIQGNLCCCIDTYQKMCANKGKFVIASNEIGGLFGDAEKLLEYKNQNKVEKGFRFLKDRQFMAATLFVKKPQRLEAILMIMALCLMVYAALEYELRTKLKEQQQTVPNQSKKQINNPTMRWIFTLFRGIHCLSVEPEQPFMVINLNEVQQKIILLLGSTFMKYYKMEQTGAP